MTSQLRQDCQGRPSTPLPVKFGLERTSWTQGCHRPRHHQGRQVRPEAGDPHSGTRPVWETDTYGMVTMEKNAEYWKWVASYFIECHAASLESIPKSGSQRERKRLRRICDLAASVLEEQVSPPYLAGRSKEQEIKSTIQRCRDAVTVYGQ